MTRLRLHTCVLLASLSNAHHWSERKGLGRALFLRSPDFVHFVLLPDSPFQRASSLSADSSSELVLVGVLCELVEEVLVDGPVNWMLILTGEVVLVLEAECLQTFQVRFVVLHRLRLSPWACASSPSANHAASSLRLNFSFPCACVDFLLLVANLNGHSCDLVVP